MLTRVNGTPVPVSRINIPGCRFSTLSQLDIPPLPAIALALDPLKKLSPLTLTEPWATDGWLDIQEHLGLYLTSSKLEIVFCVS